MARLPGRRRTAGAREPVRRRPAARRGRAGRRPGRNLGVIGPDARSRRPLLCSAVGPTSTALPDDGARILLAPLARRRPDADRLAGRLPARQVEKTADGFAPTRVKELAATVRDRTGAGRHGRRHAPLVVVCSGPTPRSRCWTAPAPKGPARGAPARAGGRRARPRLVASRAAP
ncbi:hypothetical protein HBB16_12960 [Pseudonocardia sp. MCCB 268]|nr:hypothetical protein [Pseudonocardia cytotoxica]